MTYAASATSKRIPGLALLLAFPFCPGAFAQETPPEPCAGLGNLQSHWITTWESGFEGWTPDTHDIASPATFDTPDWETVGNLPGGRTGMAAFVPNLNIGDCDADDESGALNLDSPILDLPGDAEVLRISISHWVGTEYLYDGGNLKISVNSGAWELVPASAIEYGSYSGTLVSAEQFNTNPLAAEPAFTGTEGASYSSQWGETRVNLNGIANPGDSIQLRLDFGIDGCSGETGWYVDEVEVYSCTEELAPSECGNGVIDAGEQCDDGNGFNGDGCSNVCRVENGWSCSAPIPPAVVGDPGFEAGTPNPSWAEFSVNWGTPICGTSCGTGPGSGPLEGLYWAWFGGTLVYEQGSLSQEVVIPSGVSTLTFGLEASACGAPEDYIELRVDGTSRLRIDGSSPVCNTRGYTIQEVDISPYSDGASHRLEFYSEVFANGGAQTIFFVDLVEMPGTPSQCTQVVNGETRLTLVKQVINDDGGSAQASDWTLTATGPTSFSGQGPNVSSGESFEPGSYVLSESDGPTGYSAGEWQCSGGEVSGGNTVTVGSGSEVTCTIVNDDLPLSTGVEINAGHSGAWYNPDTAGQGILVDIEPATQFMFLAWFTYTTAGSEHPFEQRWFTAQGNFSGASADLVLYESSGGQFDDSKVVSTDPVGTLAVSFDDCANGTVSYSIDGQQLQGSFPISRAIPGSDGTCKQLDGQTTQAVDINAGMDGAWHNEDTSGQGFLIDAYPQGNYMFLAWFTYGEQYASGLRWMTAEGTIEGSQASLTIYNTTGGVFDDPTKPSWDSIGTMSIDFADCQNATFEYTLTNDGLSGVIPASRTIPGSDALCSSLQ